MKKLNITLIVFCFFALISCELAPIHSTDRIAEKQSSTKFVADELDEALTGNWVDTVAAQPSGLWVYQVKIAADGSFINSVKGLGMYEDQTNSEVSSWSESIGEVRQKQDSLFVQYEKTIWWDSFYDMAPDTVAANQEDFVFWCTFSITNNILKTSYLSYPADAPMVTHQNYVKAD